MNDDWIPGVDGSYTRLTAEAARDLRASGELVWWQCLWTGAERPDNALTNLQVAINGGLIPVGYISVTGYHDGAWHVQHGRAGVPDDIWEALVKVPVDVELEGIPAATIRQAVDLLATPDYGAKRRSIYSAYHAWVGMMGNPTDFTDCLLVNAFWDEDPDIDFARLPYGGWTLEQLLGEQYNGGTDICGVNVDLDMFNRSLLLEGTMPEVIDKKARTDAAMALFRQHLSGEILAGDDALAEKAYWELQYVRALAGLPIVQPAK